MTDFEFSQKAINYDIIKIRIPFLSFRQFSMLLLFRIVYVQAVSIIYV